MPVWMSVVVVILIAAGLALNLVVCILIILCCRQNMKTNTTSYESENVSVFM